ncbi:MAG: succinate dehydrogenase iron-sulfur subunit [Chloroflexi bacterium]|nr:succinate dehydrogenase iron-sulfur subunit [Chloroflexota bacterium]
MGDKVGFHVFRFDPDRDVEPRYQDYYVEAGPKTLILSALMEIKEQQDGTLSFRTSCRTGVCGSCAMLINGRTRLACKTKVEEVLKGGNTIIIEPLRNLPVIKDLVIEQNEFWEKLIAVKPWLITDPNEPEPEKERLMTVSDKDFDQLHAATDCIFCQICYSECPMGAEDRAYLGPAALVRAFRFIKDPRDKGTAERMPVVTGQNGVWRCRTIFNCAEACPKSINATAMIQDLKRKAALGKLGFGR